MYLNSEFGYLLQKDWEVMGAIRYFYNKKRKNQVNESENKEVNFLGRDVLPFILTAVEADSYQMTRDLI